MRKHAALTAQAVGCSQAPAPLSTPGGEGEGEGAAAASGASTLLHPNGRRPLAERLREGVTMCTDPVPVPLLRKYIAYARCVEPSAEGCGGGRLRPAVASLGSLFPLPAARRRYVHPALSPEAARVFQAFYLDLRATAQEGDSVPITTRQLESLVRLGQARARLELREIVTKEDAEDVVELLRESMTDVATDDFGVVDFGRGAGMSMAKQVKAFVKVLSRAAEERNSSTFTTQVRAARDGSGTAQRPTHARAASHLPRAGYAPARRRTRPRPDRVRQLPGRVEPAELHFEAGPAAVQADGGRRVERHHLLLCQVTTSRASFPVSPAAAG